VPSAWEQSRWSARSGARTNDLDGDERRHTMCDEVQSLVPLDLKVNGVKQRSVLRRQRTVGSPVASHAP
jgi:hypothetical protein